MTDPRRLLDQMAAGYQDAAILLAANHLGVFTALQGGPRTAVALARELGCDGRALDILLRALVAAGILAEESPAHVALRPELAPLLAADGSESMHSILDHHQRLLARWARLAEVVRTGKPARDPGEQRDPGDLRAFICGMKDISRRSSEEVADLLPELGRCRRLLDLGGGPGTSAIAFCRRWPEMTAVVFDLPEVVPIAAAEIAAAGLEGRIATLAGDYLADPLAAPGAAPYDAVYAANVIHSLPPLDTLRLVAGAAEVLADDGLLVLKDFFLDDSRTEPAAGARFAVNMLVGTEGGKSYTWTETEELCREAGFTRFARHPVASHSGLLAARR
jgi:SAM-dependent methyltransferase